MDPKIFTGFTLLLVILAGSAAYVYAHPSVLGLPASYTEEKSDSLFPADSTSTSVEQNPGSAQPATGGKKSPTAETLTGTIACLPHKGDGPHTMECAIGLKTDSGQYYVLTNFAYPDQADVTDRVRLVGVTVTTDKSHAIYDIVGTFQVDHIEKL